MCAFGLADRVVWGRLIDWVVTRGRAWTECARVSADRFVWGRWRAHGVVTRGRSSTDCGAGTPSAPVPGTLSQLSARGAPLGLAVRRPPSGPRHSCCASATRSRPPSRLIAMRSTGADIPIRPEMGGRRSCQAGAVEAGIGLRRSDDGAGCSAARLLAFHAACTNAVKSWFSAAFFPEPRKVIERARALRAAAPAGVSDAPERLRGTTRVRIDASARRQASGPLNDGRRRGAEGVTGVRPPARAGRERIPFRHRARE